MKTLQDMKRRPSPGKSAGFTLIELMIVVMIIGILGAVAYPAYLDSARKARRADAKSAAETVANALERYRIRNNGSYAGATFAGVYGRTTSAEGHYNLSFGDSNNDGSLADEPNAAAYIIVATPTGPQADDERCASMTLTQAGVQGATDVDGANTTTDCWQ